MGYNLKQRLGLIKEKPREKLSKMTQEDTGAEEGELNVDTGVRLQLESLRTYKPWFLIFLTALQTLGSIVQLGLGGVAPVSFSKTYSVHGESHVNWISMLFLGLVSIIQSFSVFSVLS